MLIMLLLLLIHINGNNRCKIFGQVTRERDFDKSNRTKNATNERSIQSCRDVFKVSRINRQ
jgi:hypothetical protein